MSTKIDKVVQEEIDLLKTEKETLLNSVSHLEAERLELELVMQAAQKAYYDKVKEIKAVTHPRIYDIDVEIAELSRKLSTHIKIPTPQE